jgi:hypothetical protein
MCSTADSSVPEWLRPIQKMKFERKVDQFALRLLPARPSPYLSCRLHGMKKNTIAIVTVVASSFQ